MVKILPSILVSDIDEFDNLLRKAKPAGHVHVDFIDGQFAGNTTIEPLDTESSEENKLFFALQTDAHLMVNGSSLMDYVMQASTAEFNKLIIHVETMEEYIDEGGSWERVVAYAKEYSSIKHFGIAYDLDTEIAKGKSLLDKVDTVLVMSVKAGYGGQKFEKSALEKVETLNTLRKENGYSFTICVDGGITTDNIKSVVDAGADEVCVGRRLFDGDLAANMREYQKAAE